MAKAYITIRVENSFEVEIPDDLTQDQVYDYVMDYCQDDIDLAISGGDFYLEVVETDGLEA